MPLTTSMIIKPLFALVVAFAAIGVFRCNTSKKFWKILLTFGWLYGNMYTSRGDNPINKRKGKMK